MSASPRPFVVGVAPSGRLWRGGLQRHVRDHETDIIVRVVRDLDGARHDELDVLVVDDDTSYLSLPLVTDLLQVNEAIALDLIFSELLGCRMYPLYADFGRISLLFMVVF